MARRLKTIARAYIFPADSAIVKSSIPKRQVRTMVITTPYYSMKSLTEEVMQVKRKRRSKVKLRSWKKVGGQWERPIKDISRLPAFHSWPKEPRPEKRISCDLARMIPRCDSAAVVQH